MWDSKEGHVCLTPRWLCAGQSNAEEDVSSSSSSDDDSNEMPFLARESAAAPRPSQEQSGARGSPNTADRHSKEVMDIPEAVEAVTGVNAAYLPVCAQLPAI